MVERLEFDGKMYRSQASLAEELGKSTHFVRTRVVNQGLNTTEKLKSLKPYRTVKDSIRFEGSNYASINHLANTFNVSHKTARKWVESGHRTEQAQPTNMGHLWSVYDAKTGKLLDSEVSSKQISVKYGHNVKHGLQTVGFSDNYVGINLTTEGILTEGEQPTDLFAISKMPSDWNEIKSDGHCAWSMSEKSIKLLNNYYEYYGA